MLIAQHLRAACAIGAVVNVLACSSASVQTPTNPSPASSPNGSGPSGPGVLPPAPYTYTGIVTDSRGQRVSGAEVWIYSNGSPVDQRWGEGFTDSVGRYSITSPIRVAQAVRALKNGYVPNDVQVLGPPAFASTWTTDVRIRRITRYVLLSPSAVKVGESVKLEAQVDLDDGSSSKGTLFMESSSSDEAVLTADGYTGWIRGIASGVATITTTYYGASASLQVRVFP